MSNMPERLMSMTAGRALSLDAIPGGGKPEWTAEDAAMACQGLERRVYAAFAYRWARDESLYSTLWAALFNAASALAEMERWPSRTSGNQRYLDRLVRLAIYEEWNPPGVLISRMSSDERAALFQQDQEAIAELLQDGLTSRLRPILLAAQAEVSVEIWRDELSRRYEGIRGILEAWCARAHRHALRWIGFDGSDAPESDVESDSPATVSTYKNRRNDKIVSDFCDGTSVPELSATYGISPRHVYRLLKARGVDLRPCFDPLGV